MNIGVDLRALGGDKISGVKIYITSLLEEIFKLDKKNHYFLWWNSATEDFPKNPQLCFGGVMVEKLNAVLKTLNDNTEDADFTQILDVNKQRYVFLGEIDCENQHMLAIIQR